MSVSVETHGQQTAVVISGSKLRSTVIPAAGAKIASLVWLPSGRELLWQDSRDQAPLVRPGAYYVDGDRGGIDDCFPSVESCGWPGPGVTRRIGDHGEVWTRPWTWTADEANMAATFVCRTGTLPFRLSRQMTITDGTLRLDYELSVEDDRAHPYQWTGHPLLAVEPGTVIELPPGTSAWTGFATGDRLAPRTGPWAWPYAPDTTGKLVDVSHIEPLETAVNEKYWVRAPASGCRLITPGSRDSLVLRYDPEQLPWLAVCVNYGGWPPDAPAHWVALEPATSPEDSLADTWAAGRALWVDPGQTQRWWWSLTWQPAGSTEED